MNAKRYTVSVGIPAYNEAANIKYLLEALLAQKEEGFALKEIIVVSDCSTDKTAELVRSVADPRITLIENKARIGQALSQNVILEKFDADILVLLNADVLPVNKNMLKNIVQPFQIDTGLGIVSGQLVPAEAVNFFGKIIRFSALLKQDIYEKINAGKNVYLCHGGIRAFSRNFARQLKWSSQISEDAYSYFACISLGFEFAYASSAKVYFRSSGSLKDHLRQSARFRKGKRDLLNCFSKKLVHDAHKIPAPVFFTSLAKYFLRNPVLFLSYVVIYVFSIFIYYIVSKQITSIWEPSVTTKTLFASARAKKVLIPNATNPQNIGDHAILTGLLKMVSEHDADVEIIIHSTEPGLYAKSSKETYKPTLYAWAVFERQNFFIRIWRVAQLGFAYVLFSLGLSFLLWPGMLKKLLHDYQSADVIIFAGGGYLRSKRGITQFLNLLMQILIISFAKFARARKIVAPMSFGPFAYKWQEKISAHVLKKIPDVFVREEISYETLKGYSIKNLVMAPDLALALDPIRDNGSRHESFTLGFTVRKWFDDKRQEELENTLVQAITEIAHEQTIEILPIVQVNSIAYGDDDLQVTRRIYDKVAKSGVSVRNVRVLKDLEDALAVYAQVDLLVGMRMHSNILTAVNGVPFIAIAYEHKTDGIAEYLGFKKYCIDAELVDSKKLFGLLADAYKSASALKDRVKQAVEKIRREKFSPFGCVLGNALAKCDYLRILHLDYDDRKNPFARGGQANSTYEIYRRLSKQHKVTVLTGNYPGAQNMIIENIHYRRIGIGKWGAFASLVSYWFVLPWKVYRLQREFDVIVENFTAPVSVSLVPFVAKVPVIACATFLGAKDLSEKYKLPFQHIADWGIKKYRRIIALTEYSEQEIIRMNDEAETRIIPRGISREYLNIDPFDGDYVLYLGRVDIFNKQLDLLIDSFKKLTQQKNDALLVIAGSGKESELKRLNSLIRKANIKQNVKLVGHVTDQEKVDLIAKSKFVVYPSRFETFGNVALEALACAKPLVCFDIPGFHWIPKEVCRKVDPTDRNGLEKEMMELYYDTFLRLELGRKSREFARGYSWEKTSEKHIAFIKEAVCHA